MPRKVRAEDLPEFDASRYLDSDAAIAEYLTALIDEKDPSVLAAALGDIARARGMAQIAEATGLTREALYKALREGAHPRFETISRVCNALGLRLIAQPVADREASSH
jgi:probable addiction module antidote protein